MSLNLRFSNAMKESFLHWVWQQQLLETQKLTTVHKEKLQVLNVGVLNTLQGPDFGNALIKINGQKWAGNIEIHVKSSDWYAHQHQKDENYQNVILHVVYEDDVEVYDKHNNVIPTLELKHIIQPNVLNNYESLMQNTRQWIFCEDALKNIDSFLLDNWLERVYVERLERKIKEVEVTYQQTGKDWEATLFLYLAKYFGGNLNGELFLDAFSQVDFSILRKEMANNTLDAMLFGLAGLLEEDGIEDAYYLQLKRTFVYQKQKYQLEDLLVPNVHFYGCRPPNFPTIRLAQLVALYQNKKKLFAEMLQLGAETDLYKDILSVSVNDYWQEHYNFYKTSKKSPKRISKDFTDLLLINVMIPILFLYAKTLGTKEAYLLELMYDVKPERNTIVTKFKELGVRVTSALHSQSLLTLKKEYCEKERCAECAIGIACLKG
ncbi:DUF2851 family protein [Wenyingzhuangia sp. IMCC45574]